MPFKKHRPGLLEQRQVRGRPRRTGAHHHQGAAATGPQGARPGHLLRRALGQRHRHPPSVDKRSRRAPAGSSRPTRTSSCGGRFSYKDLAPRAENKWQAYGKLTYRLSSTNKFALSFTKTIAIDQGYTRYDPYDVTRETSGYQHDWSRHLDHYLTYTEDSNSLAFSWNQILSENTFHVLRVSRFFNCIHADVAGKHWHDYEEPDDYSQLGDADTPYFVETGDADLWHDRYVETYNFGWDFTVADAAAPSVQGRRQHLPGERASTSSSASPG